MIKNSDNQQVLNSDEIDLLNLFDTILDRKWFIGFLTLICAITSFIFAASKAPDLNYKATALIHLGTDSMMPSLGGLETLTDNSSSSSAYIEYLSSRSLIGEVVDHLDLTSSIKPHLFPILGSKKQYLFQPVYKGELAKPLFEATNYAWGGEKVEVSDVLVPKDRIDVPLKLVSGPNSTFSLYQPNDVMILSGLVGRTISKDQYRVRVDHLNARPGTEFILIKSNRFDTISHLQSKIKITPKGNSSSNVISLSYSQPDPKKAELVLNTLIARFISHNIERNSMDVKNSLNFLQTQLPLIQNSLQQSESLYNEFQKSKNTVDINYESKSLLSSLVTLNRRARDLEDQHLEMSHRYKSAHPKIKGIIEKLTSIDKQITIIENKVKLLPETQSKLSQLTRKVEVGKDTYMQLLSKAQELELEIVRAGTSRNIHIIDPAEASIKPLSNRKLYLTTTLGTLLGFIFSISIIIIGKIRNNGIENAADIESMGLPVYATIPRSDLQVRRDKKSQAKLLSITDPSNFVVEYFRSLRTSLHFAMTDNNARIVSITGSTPGVGKSFVSSNLSGVIANTGIRVLLIDGDMRKGCLHKVFSRSSKEGLSNILAGTISAYDAIKTTDIDNLDFISRGVIPPNPAELLMHPRFEIILNDLSKKYDFILIDTPPILTVTDSAIIAKFTSATLLVAKYQETSLQEIDHTRKKFKQNGIEIKGVVLNAVNMSSRYHIYAY